MECNPRYIRIAELARLSGLTTYYIRKWTGEGLIPHVRRPGERVLYPEDEAMEAVRQILEPKGGLGTAA
jgi:excisionase family DNA binding protein